MIVFFCWKKKSGFEKRQNVTLGYPYPSTLGNLPSRRRDEILRSEEMRTRPRTREMLGWVKYSRGTQEKSVRPEGHWLWESIDYGKRKEGKLRGWKMRPAQRRLQVLVRDAAPATVFEWSSLPQAVSFFSSSGPEITHKWQLCSYLPGNDTEYSARRLASLFRSSTGATKWELIPFSEFFCYF